MAWNGSNGTANVPKTPTAKAPSKMRGIVAGLVVVAAAAVCVFVFMGKGEKPVEKAGKKTPRVIKEVTPAKVPKAKTGIEKTPVEVEEPETEKDPPVVVTKPTGPQGRVMRLMDGTIITNRTPVIFEREFEKGLMVALRPNGISGTLLAEIRAENSDEQILAMLKELTLPKDDDPPGVARVKNDVQALKEQMLLEIQNGRTVAEVFAEIQSVKALDHMVNVKTMRMQREAIDGGDAEEVRRATERVNEMRRRRGLDPLEVPEEFRAPEGDQFTDQNQFQSTQEEDNQ